MLSYSKVITDVIQNSIFSNAGCHGFVTGLETVRSGVDNLMIQPNPASDVIYIPGLEKGQLLMISDITGKTVMRMHYENHALDISSLKDGIYFLVLEDSNHFIRLGKFVKL